MALFHINFYLIFHINKEENENEKDKKNIFYPLLRLVPRKRERERIKKSW